MSSEADSYVSHFFESSLSQINASVVHAFATCMVDLSISCASMIEAHASLALDSCRQTDFSKPRRHSFQHIVYKRQRHS